MKTRKSLRETLKDSQRGLDAWAAMHGKPQTVHIPIAEKRTMTKRTAYEDTEAVVMREVGELLAVHPLVLFAVRQNSGMSYNEVGVPIWFYRWTKRKAPMRITDYWGLLTDGRMFALECKRRTWTKPSGDREGEQQNFLMTVRNVGGVSGFVRSAEEAKSIIESIIEGVK